MTTPILVSEDWQDKLQAQQRHEHLAATVRIALGELCFLAEQQDALEVAERLYGIADLLENQLKDGEVAYTEVESVPS